MGIRAVADLEHGRAHNLSTTCKCGGLLYEGDHGDVYCVATDIRVYAPEPRHLPSCRRDDNEVWVCRASCPVLLTQGELL